MADFFVPFSGLVAQVAAIVVAGAVVAVLLARWHLSMPAAVALVLAAIMLCLGVSSLWGTLPGLDNFKSAALSRPPGVDARQLCFAQEGQQSVIPVETWAAAHMPPNGRYVVASPTPGLDFVCFAQNMLPRILEPTAASADYVFSMNGIPAPFNTEPRGGHLPLAVGHILVDSSGVGVARIH